MFDTIIKYFQKRKLLQLLQEGKGIKRDFVSLSKAKTIALIININQCNPEDIKDIHKYIDDMRAKGVTVVVIEINYVKKSVAAFGKSAHSVFVSPEKTNWYDCPQAAIQQQITQHKVDILLNFDTSEHMTAHFICAMSHAKNRMGAYHEQTQSFYEIMLADLKETRFKKVLPLYEHFLKMLEK